MDLGRGHVKPVNLGALMTRLVEMLPFWFVGAYPQIGHFRKLTLLEALQVGCYAPNFTVTMEPGLALSQPPGLPMPPLQGRSANDSPNFTASLLVKAVLLGRFHIRARV